MDYIPILSEIREAYRLVCRAREICNEDSLIRGDRRIDDGVHVLEAVRSGIRHPNDLDPIEARALYRKDKSYGF